MTKKTFFQIYCVNSIIFIVLHIEEDLSPEAKRKTSKELIEITQEEFDSVSSSVRGRLKLQDVNTVSAYLSRFLKYSKTDML